MQFLTLLAIKKPRKKKSNHHLISLKNRQWCAVLGTLDQHTHSCSSRSKPTNNLKSLQNYQVQYTNRWQRSTDHKHCISDCLRPFFYFFPHLQQLWLQFLLPDFFWRAQKNLFPPDVLTWEPWSSNLFVALHTHTHTHRRTRTITTPLKQLKIQNALNLCWRRSSL